MTRADELSRKVERAAQAVRRIRALSRTQPHVFCEDKDAVFRDLMDLAVELRNTFGGPATQFRTGRLVVGGSRRDIRVETRRAA